MGNVRDRDDGGPGDRNDGAVGTPGEEDDGVAFEVPPQLLVRHTELTRVEHDDGPRPEPVVRNGAPILQPNDSRGKVFEGKKKLTNGKPDHKLEKINKTHVCPFDNANAEVLPSPFFAAIFLPRREKM